MTISIFIKSTLIMQSNCSQKGTVWPFSRHMKISGDIFDDQNLWHGRGLLISNGKRVQILFDIFKCTGKSPPTKN